MTSSADHQETQDRARRFVSDRIRPHAGEFDRLGRIPQELVASLGSEGFLCAQVPGRHGGPGLDPHAYGLLHYEFGRGCSSVRSLLTVQDMVAECIVRVGGSNAAERWLPDLISGESLAAFALTEPDAGSDAGAIETLATPTDGGVLLNGAKRWVSFGQIAGLFLIFARSSPSGLTSGWLVQRDSPGLGITPMEPTVGLKASMLAELRLENCFVPNSARLGPEDMPSGLLESTALQLGRFGVAWGCVGLADECLEASLHHSSSRKQFGKPLGEHQLIKRKLAKMVSSISAARQLCIHAGEQLERREPDHVMAVLVAKYVSSLTATQAATDAVQIHGAVGLSPPLPIERFYRDARVMEIIEGSTEIQEVMIADRARRDFQTRSRSATSDEY